MKTNDKIVAQKIALLLPKHIANEAVAAAIPATGLMIRRTVTSYSFANFGGGGVRMGCEFVDAAAGAPAVRAAKDFLSSIGCGTDGGTATRDADWVMGFAKPEFSNGALFNEG